MLQWIARLDVSQVQNLQPRMSKVVSEAGSHMHIPHGNNGFPAQPHRFARTDIIAGRLKYILGCKQLAISQQEKTHDVHTTHSGLPTI